MALPEKESGCTFADCLAWEGEDQIEMIDGRVYRMAPPLFAHQAISGEIFRQLANYLDGKPCRVYAAPFGVRLFERDGERPEDVNTMVQPDISVICDRRKLDRYGCKGAPDMIVEILSPSSRRHDRLVKLNLYQRAGVREYWIVNPEEQSVQVFLPCGGLLHLHEEYEDIAAVHVLEGCFIDLAKVFAALRDLE